MIPIDAIEAIADRHHLVGTDRLVPGFVRAGAGPHGGRAWYERQGLLIGPDHGDADQPDLRGLRAAAKREECGGTLAGERLRADLAEADAVDRDRDIIEGRHGGSNGWCAGATDEQ
jgi:hypothetical protein